MTSWPRRLLFALCGLLLLSSLGTATAASSPIMQVEEPNETASSFDRVTFDVTVEASGDATWVFRYERRLESDEEIQQFETYAERFRTEDTPFFERRTADARSLVETGSDVTGRDMVANNFERTARVEQRTNVVGVIEISFRWEAFAPLDGSNVIVNDVLAGTYLGSDQVLVIRAGEGLNFVTVQPEAAYSGSSIESAEAVSWSGERRFAPGQPYVELAPPTTEESIPWLLVGGGLAAALVIGGAIVWYRSGGLSSDAGSSDDPGPTGDGDVGLTDDELLTDDDRVLQLIEANGGRMKQVNIVEETGWSKSKVSMLLSEMAEEGTISKLRVGRENIISLEGFEPRSDQVAPRRVIAVPRSDMLKQRSGQPLIVAPIV
ncbi:MAG: helix-turn-helix domain-containing protein [Natrialbaceae archaeon]|nr:helix-turn-helix domain-containing protein [Natrialbaceae archaeon]